MEGAPGPTAPEDWLAGSASQDPWLPVWCSYGPHSYIENSRGQVCRATTGLLHTPHLRTPLVMHWQLATYATLTPGHLRHYRSGPSNEDQ